MFGDLGKIMKIAGQVKRKMPEMQAKLAAAQYTAASGGDAVVATVNGKMAVMDITIAPAVLSDDQMDAEMLGDLVKSAVAAAQAQASEAAAEAMKQLTGGMEIPGLLPLE